MKVLILGGDGMLGHQLLQSLSNDHEVYVTLREEEAVYAAWPQFNAHNTFFGVNLLDDFTLVSTILNYKPDVIINASGVIKYRPKAADRVYSLQINALLPHRLSMISKNLGIKLITFSTDCVFSGKTGNYLEDDAPDGFDIYGQTKYAGEIKDDENCLTLRTSFFGMELKYFTGLIEWFLHSTGKVLGYTKAIYSGLSTQEMARVINLILKQHPTLHGLYHVSAEPINKYDLLSTLSHLMGRQDIEIQPDDTFAMDRSLNADRFKQATGYLPPSWNNMLNELTQSIKKREKYVSRS